MNYPEFFNTIETIKLQDPLSNLLGTFENGLVEFSYLDIVKSAGHSCPTVSGAYIMAMVGLKELYQDEIPTRGDIFVSFKEDDKDGVAGVIGTVLSQITGATESLGFKGLNGNFARHDLMQFNANITSSIKLQRLDTGKSVELIYNPSQISQDERVPQLMQKIMQNTATPEDKKLFGQLWQKRVEAIFANISKVITIL
ncbi:FmdE family protein [Arcobacteraceae bacterium]|nr:FmdE family protein [Arcobacteraceae bacterium]